MKSNLLIKIFLTWGGLGLLPKMPGTWGTLGALPVGIFLMHRGGPPLLLGTASGLFLLSCMVIPLYLKKRPFISDPQEIVIDEVIGMWVALSICHNNPYLIGLAFLAFRFFDIIKIWPANWVETLKGNSLKKAMAILLDDVIAGLYAIATVYLILKVYEAFFA